MGPIQIQYLVHGYKSGPLGGQSASMTANWKIGPIIVRKTTVLKLDMFIKKGPLALKSFYLTFSKICMSSGLEGAQLPYTASDGAQICFPLYVLDWRPVLVLHVAFAFEDG